MCETCGCHGDGPVSVERQVQTSLLAANDTRAAKIRARFDARGILAINIMSAPGAGKTALLEATARQLSGTRRMAAIVGDLATENDAGRLRAAGMAAEQIVTGTACHLDAAMVEAALDRLTLEGLDMLFIENVGNLVCPAAFDLGQHVRVALLSTPEGDDKPSKYPVLFRSVDLVLLTKRDLAPFMPEFDPALAGRRVRDLCNAAPILELSARTGAGLDGWCDWLADAALRCRARRDHARKAGQ